MLLHIRRRSDVRSNLVEASSVRQCRSSAGWQIHITVKKNKMFTPHLLVVPAGSSMAFPKTDPFFHNVF